METQSKWLPKPSFAMTVPANEGYRVGEGDVVMIHRIATLPGVKNLFPAVAAGLFTLQFKKYQFGLLQVGDTVRATLLPLFSGVQSAYKSDHLLTLII